MSPPTHRPPPSPNAPPAEGEGETVYRALSPFEAFARDLGKVALRVGARALARGAGEVVASVAEDADKGLEAADRVVDVVKDAVKKKIADARARARGER